LDVEEEKRRFHRLPLSLPVEFTAFHPETGELRQGQGFLKDFSLNGVFFYAPSTADLQPGHILTLTITTPVDLLCSCDCPHIQARGEVVRLEPDAGENGHHGVAVCFQDFPRFLPRPSSTAAGA
jgi:hypothetical protein